MTKINDFLKEKITEYYFYFREYCRANKILVLCDEIYSRLHYTYSHDTLYRVRILSKYGLENLV